MIKTLGLILLLTLGIVAQDRPIINTAYISGQVNPLDAPTTLLISQNNVRIRVVNLTTFSRQDVGVDTLGHYSVQATGGYEYLVRPYITGRGMLQFPRSAIIIVGQQLQCLEYEDITADFSIYLQFY